MPWKKMQLRDSQVLARVDESGQPVVVGGRVEVRYGPRSPKAYRAAAGNLAPIAGSPVLPDDHCVEVAPDESPPAASRARTAGTPAARKGAASAGTQPAHSRDAVIVYADGACSGNPGPAGLGLVVIDEHVRTERSEYIGEATNNIAELMAVQRALELTDGSDKPVEIFTDSQYSIGVLSLGWKAKANQELIGELREMLRDRRNVRFVHVRGHAGVLLNERADQLARRAVAERDTKVETFRTRDPRGASVDEPV